MDAGQARGGMTAQAQPCPGEAGCCAEDLGTTGPALEGLTISRGNVKEATVFLGPLLALVSGCIQP